MYRMHVEAFSITYKTNSSDILAEGCFSISHLTNRNVLSLIHCHGVFVSLTYTEIRFILRILLCTSFQTNSQECFANLLPSCGTQPYYFQTFAFLKTSRTWVKSTLSNVTTDYWTERNLFVCR